MIRRLPGWVRQAALGLCVTGATASAADPAPPLADFLPAAPSALPAATAPAKPAAPANPPILGRDVAPEAAPPGPPPEPTFTGTLVDPTPGYSGRSGVRLDTAASLDYVPMADRWRIGYPAWDRYGRGHPLMDQYPYILGRIQDPYAQNVLKGDYPIIGQHTFLTLTGTIFSVNELRQIPSQTTPFESTKSAFHEENFGDPDQYFSNNFFTLSADLFNGDAAFKPVDWRLKTTGVFNFNYLSVDELAIVSPNVLKGTTRGRTWFALQEFFAEYKLADLSSEYDFVSIRAGSQPFSSDFRGFIYADTNMMARVFGTRRGNKEQFNFVYTDQFEKDTFSGLNSFQDRNQHVAIANYFIQDFLFPGYTASPSIHYNDDRASIRFDRAGNLVRPDPAGVAQQHAVRTVYFGLTGDGHMDRFNVSNAFFWVIGTDTLNPIANQRQDVSAQLAALELSYDRDWARFRVSGVYASGDGDPSNGKARGFDAILPNTNFAGGAFSYFQRQNVPLFALNLANRTNFLPNLRSSQLQGQANHVNPGLFLVNAGVDFDITPKLRSINNCNFLWFDKTAVLEQFTFQPGIDQEIGTDLSSGFEYRPLLNNNIIFLGGAAVLFPSGGFKAIYSKFNGSVAPLASLFLEMTFTY